MKHFFLMLAVIVAVVAGDQISKALILSSFGLGEQFKVVPGFFNLTLTFNRGAAFGLFATVESDLLRYTLLGGTTLFALLIVVVLMMRDFRESRAGHFALALILGGAIGNIIDRVRFGAVVDFLDVHLGAYHWPAFNVADSAICVGVACLLVLSTFAEKKVASTPQKGSPQNTEILQHER